MVGQAYAAFLWSVISRSAFRAKDSICAAQGKSSHTREAVYKLSVTL